MNKKNIVFADIEKAKDIIKVQYPNAKNISFVENGYDNLVILIDKTYVLRFPRNKKAYIKSKYERIILKSLDTISYIGIPKLLGEGLNPPYLIETFLNGVHLKSEEIDEFTLPLQQEFGSSVGTFAFNIHKTLSITHIELFMKKFQISPVLWNEYFNTRIVKHSFLSSQQYKLAKGCYEEWIKLNKINQKLVIIHDDLHTDNMLFENKKLTGVLDFADTNIGTPEQEFRQLYRINNFVLECAVKKYNQLSGLNINISAVKNWAIMQELAVYAEKVKWKDFTHRSFARASKNLNKWLPQGKWNEVSKRNIDI